MHAEAEFDITDAGITRLCPTCKQTLSILPGQKWINSQNFEVTVVDACCRWVWVKFENGNRTAFESDNLLKEYSLQK